jgi:DNA polymerase delta subunit 1
MDTDYYVSPRVIPSDHRVRRLAERHHVDMRPVGRSGVPVVRIYGVTECGRSVLAHVHGYEPYFYIRAPPGFEGRMCTAFAEELNSTVASMASEGMRERARRDRGGCSDEEGGGGGGGRGDAPDLFVRRVEVCHRTTVWTYQHVGQPQDLDGSTQFLRVYTVLPRHVSTARTALESGFDVPFGIGRCTFLTYEANVAFVMRYMVDSGIVGGGWVTMPGGCWVERTLASSVTSSCSAEVDVMWPSVVAHAAEGEWLKVSPGIRTLSFDIECCGRWDRRKPPRAPSAASVRRCWRSLTNWRCLFFGRGGGGGRKGVFPVPEHDPVIQIASCLQHGAFGSGEKSRLETRRTILVLGSCASIAGAEVRSFESEEDMLLAWRDLVAAYDPDVITGYNIVGFDIPYLVERARTLGLDRFPFLGRVTGCPSRVRRVVMSSKQSGARDTFEVTVDGRVVFDVLQAVRSSYKLHSYTLNAVSAHFLGDQKEDVHHSVIADLQNGDEHTRRRLAVYCIKDAYLPLRLIDKLMLMYNYLEMARVTGVPLGWLLVRGQMLKVRKPHPALPPP